MRTEKEMLDIIIATAENDERIRAAYMNGSRANPSLPKDIYQDYDIVYVVQNIDTFIQDNNWIDIFGKRLMLQMPESMRGSKGDGRIVYLMLFDDGTRIDLTLIPIQKKHLITEEKLSISLLDKDKILPLFDNDLNVYNISKPSRFYYESCLNDFWWCIQNVAKGIARNEVSYAMSMYHEIVTGELNEMISWYIGTIHDFKVSAGKMGRNFKRYLPEDIYLKYIGIYSDANKDNMWNALFCCCSLFSETALSVSKYFGYEYNFEDEKNMTKYLTDVKCGYFEQFKV